MSCILETVKFSDYSPLVRCFGLKCMAIKESVQWCLKLIVQKFSDSQAVILSIADKFHLSQNSVEIRNDITQSTSGLAGYQDIRGI